MNIAVICGCALTSEHAWRVCGGGGGGGGGGRVWVAFSVMVLFC